MLEQLQVGLKVAAKGPLIADINSWTPLENQVHSVSAVPGTVPCQKLEDNLVALYPS